MEFKASERVPYFFFSERENGEDIEKTKEFGYAVPKMVTMIHILPHGGRGDPQEFYAEDFLVRKEREARNGMYDQEWVREFKKGLESHRDGKELPRSGTPLITYERLLKSRREQLAKRFPTVEDLAAVPDSSLNEIGLDGRVIRDLARADIQAKKDLSPVVKELAEAKEIVRRQEDIIVSLERRLEALESSSDLKSKKK
jgi:hypothetical protein